ncbi:MAG: hypothetical protein JNJ60_14240 [Rhodocyclaceae bacterium]|nr:hypothetical protein [Rhodocyclaceae bacterium]
MFDEFKDIAFTWTRDRSRECGPAYFLEVTSDTSCTHLVWLSHKTASYSEMLFSFVFAHELRHVYQSRFAFPREEIKKAVQPLRRQLNYIQMPPKLFVEAEVDSELFALRTLNEMYGRKTVAHFLKSTPLPRYPYPEYPCLLQEAYGLLQP